ncbi:MAG: tetratricopeptide repeat protein, partial [Blastocatellia bacterium]
LGQPATRATYDGKIRKGSGPLTKELPRTPANAEHTANERGAPDEEDAPSGELSSSNGQPDNTGPLPQTTVESTSVAVLSATTKNSPQLPPAQMAEHYYQQGRARFERKEYHAAVHLLREAIKLDPSRAPYHYHLGLALIRNPRTRRDAELHLSRAAELEPYNAQIRVKLGQLYKEAGLSKKAENYFREALQLDPENRVAKREISDSAAKGKSAVGSLWKSGTFAKRIFKK